MRLIRLSEPIGDVVHDYLGLTDVALRRRIEPENGLYIAESTKVISRAISSGHRPRSVLTQEKWLEELAPLLEGFDVPVYLGDEALLASITGFGMHRGALAAMHRPQLPQVADLLSGARRVVVIEDVVDHTNVGAIFRAAAGLGADAILITSRCADPLYRRSIRVSMGTVFQVPWTRLPRWPASVVLFHDAGFTLAGLALDESAATLDEFAAHPPDKIALMVGTEGDGLSRNALRGADVVVKIPMLHGVDSLNVAAASAVALWALRT